MSDRGPGQGQTTAQPHDGSWGVLPRFRDFIMHLLPASEEHVSHEKSADDPSASGQRGDSLEEGCLVTGIIDITNERAYMVPSAQDKDKDEAMVRPYLCLAGHLTYKYNVSVSTRPSTSSP